MVFLRNILKKKIDSSININKDCGKTVLLKMAIHLWWKRSFFFSLPPAICPALMFSNAFSMVLRSPPCFLQSPHFFSQLVSTIMNRERGSRSCSLAGQFVKTISALNIGLVYKNLPFCYLNVTSKFSCFHPKWQQGLMLSAVFMGIFDPVLLQHGFCAVAATVS